MNYLSKYQAEVDRVSRDEWSSLLCLFDDANIIQTWDFARIVCPRQQVSRLVLRGQGETVGIAQVRIAALPFYSRGIACVAWGPVWRGRGKPADPQVFEAMMEALREEYVVRRKLLLRLSPHISTDDGKDTARVLVKMGFRKVTDINPYRTLVKDISMSLPEIRKGLLKDWRQSLARGERNNLEIRQGISSFFYDEFLPIYRDLLERKGFESESVPGRWAKLQEALPDQEKPHVFLAYHEGKAVSGLILSGLGDIGFPIFSATHRSGLKLNSSNLLFWRGIEWLKQVGCHYFDLGGIDPETYRFKSELGGKEVSFIGVFELCQNSFSRMLVKLGEPARRIAIKVMKRRL
jgi:hypothetical protein